MTNKITFFAIVGRGATVDRPLGLVRRLQYDNGWEDEVLRKDFSWRRSPLIVEWERGSYENELVEVSHEQASGIVQYLREKFADPGEQPADPDPGP
jgi:hypothetical protein